MSSLYNVTSHYCRAEARISVEMAKPERENDQRDKLGGPRLREVHHRVPLLGDLPVTVELEEWFANRAQER